MGGHREIAKSSDNVFKEVGDWIGAVPNERKFRIGNNHLVQRSIILGAR